MAAELEQEIKRELPEHLDDDDEDEDDDDAQDGIPPSKKIRLKGKLISLMRLTCVYKTKQKSKIHISC